MTSPHIAFRNAILHTGYVYLVKPVFFLFDPEFVHDHINHSGRLIGRVPLLRTLTRLAFGYRHPMLKQKIAGITYDNPVGLAAGFDKDAYLIKTIPAVGFGFMEVGSITARPCTGNPKPHLWRLKKSKSLVVNYGLKSEGVDLVKARLEKTSCIIPLGLNIARTNCAETASDRSGIADYLETFQKLKGLGDYVTLNISCPNTSGGQPFHKPELLRQLLEALTPERKHDPRPLFVKISPDLSHENVGGIVDICLSHKVTGIICANLTKTRTSQHIKESSVPPEGGLSGKVQEPLSNELISFISERAKGKLIIIGLGGVFSAEDAYEKIRRGASLVQLVSGLIFEGPSVVSEINRRLVDLMKRDGYHNIHDVIGTRL